MASPGGLDTSFAGNGKIGHSAPLGIGGERLHEWMVAGKSASDSFETAHFGEIGASVLGRRMADLAGGPWGEEPTFHAPCFVVTHRPAETIVRKGGTRLFDGVRTDVRLVPREVPDQPAVTHLAYDVGRATPSL